MKVNHLSHSVIDYCFVARASSPLTIKDPSLKSRTIHIETKLDRGTNDEEEQVDEDRGDEEQETTSMKKACHKTRKTRHDQLQTNSSLNESFLR